MKKVNMVLIVLMITGSAFAGVVEEIEASREACNQMTDAVKRDSCFHELGKVIDETILVANRAVGKALGASGVSTEASTQIIDDIAQMRNRCNQMADTAKRNSCFHELGKVIDETIFEANRAVGKALGASK